MSNFILFPREMVQAEAMGWLAKRIDMDRTSVIMNIGVNIFVFFTFLFPAFVSCINSYNKKGEKKGFVFGFMAFD